MSNRFDPPAYTWTATTTSEAMQALEAARVMIDSHLQTLHPEQGSKFERTDNHDPVSLTLWLDLSGLVAAINDGSLRSDRDLEG